MVQQAQVTLVSPSGVAIRPLVESALRSESKMVDSVCYVKLRVGGEYLG